MNSSQNPLSNGPLNPKSVLRIEDAALVAMCSFALLTVLTLAGAGVASLFGWL